MATLLKSRRWRVLAVILGVLVAAGALTALLRDSGSRLYSEESPFNQPVSSDAAVDPNSQEYVRMLVQEVEDKGFVISTGRFTNTLYYADGDTPRYDVELTGQAYSGRRLLGVPVPDGARVPDDTDGGLAVIDRSTDCEYDFDEARKTPDGWSAEFANGLSTKGTGIYPFAEAPSASGMANAAGMILPEELEAGEIDHALAFTMSNTKAGGPVAPATGSDGRSDAAGAIPEGARVQLDPDLDLDALGLKTWEKTIARAMQEYGMYLVDTGGAVSIRVQHSLSTSYAYPWGRGPYGQMPASLARHMRVLRTGPQKEPTYRFVRNECARLSPRREAARGSLVARPAPHAR